MSSKNFPGPNINRLIDEDPQIIKVPMEKMGWGSRPSGLPQGDAAPKASEMTIKHVGK